MGPKCAHYAPTLRPLCPETFLELNRWAQSAPPMRLLCAHQAPHYVHKPFRSGTDGPKVRPLCAHYAPTISVNRFGVEPMGPKGAHNAPTMRPLCAHYAHKPFWG